MIRRAIKAEGPVITLGDLRLFVSETSHLPETQVINIILGYRDESTSLITWWIQTED